MGRKMVSGEEEEEDMMICNVPVRSQTKPCTSEVRTRFRFRSM